MAQKGHKANKAYNKYQQAKLDYSKAKTSRNTQKANSAIQEGVNALHELQGYRGVPVVSHASGNEVIQKVERGQVQPLSTTKPTQQRVQKPKAICTTGNSCFTAGTFIETSEGLKATETFTGGELIWTRND
ncbi:hypothetical protein, partial [Moraxella sp.]|uniref:hypothetical protein n=1 Tax=Moraxella sp. TaxID=479 RepID=UPI0026DD7ACC